MRISDWSSDVCSSDLYQFVGVARDDGKDKGEFSPLGFRRDRFTLVGSGTFWLSPTPDTPSKGWDAARAAVQRRPLGRQPRAIGSKEQVGTPGLALRLAEGIEAGRADQIGRASCRERGCQYG